MRRLLSILVVLGIGYLFFLLGEAGLRDVSARVLGPEPSDLETTLFQMAVGLVQLAVSALLAGMIAKPGDGAAAWLLYGVCLVYFVLYVVLVNRVEGEFLLWLEKNYPELSRLSVIIWTLVAVATIAIFHDLGQRVSRRFSSVGDH